jgi:hypothetical protein
MTIDKDISLDDIRDLKIGDEIDDGKHFSKIIDIEDEYNGDNTSDEITLIYENGGKFYKTFKRN